MTREGRRPSCIQTDSTGRTPRFQSALPPVHTCPSLSDYWEWPKRRFMPAPELLFIERDIEPHPPLLAGKAKEELPAETSLECKVNSP